MKDKSAWRGEQDSGSPSLTQRVEADVRALRGMTPLRDGADGPPQWRLRQSHLAQRPGREKRKTRGHSCTSHTEQHQAGVSHSFTQSLTHSLTHPPRSVSLFAFIPSGWGDWRMEALPDGNILTVVVKRFRRTECCLAGHPTATWHMLVADDFHLEAGRQDYRFEVISFFI